MILSLRKTVCLGLLLLLSDVAAATVHLPVAEALVTFFPEREGDGLGCQGVLLSENRVATSYICAEMTRRHSSYEPIDVYHSQGRLAGVIREQSDSALPEQGILLRIDSGTADVTESPEIYHSALPPQQAFAYSIDEEQQTIKEPVTLTASQTRTGFDLSTKSPPPSGSPVFDDHNRLVCLSDQDSQCFTFGRLEGTHTRREAGDDPYDDGGSSLSGLELYGIMFGAVSVVAITSTAGFYLAAYLRARSKGMPSNVFWAGILSLHYCNYCDSDSITYAVIGLFCLPFCVCPAAAYIAASNWIDDYAITTLTDHQRTPIVHQPRTLSRY